MDYTYDANDNRVLEVLNTGTLQQTGYAYGPGNNRLVQVTPPGSAAVSYGYDAAGNLLSDGKNTFIYGDRGRMARANTTQYAYNGLGQRVRKTGPTSRLFVYDEAGHLIGEYTSTGAIFREVVYLGDTPVAMLTNGSALYIHADHLDTPRALVDILGKTVWRWDADPFGSALPDENPDGDAVTATFNWRFPGQYYDSETKLHHNVRRDYAPQRGRYVQSDPIGLAGGINTYGYVGGNPVSRVDPDGLVENGGTGPWTTFPSSDFTTGGNPRAVLNGVVEGASSVLAPEAKFIGGIAGILGNAQVQNIIKSSLAAARAGSKDSRAVQALKKKVDRCDPAYVGLSKDQETANKIIQDTLGNNNKNPVIKSGMGRNGQPYTDYFDANTGRGVRLINGNFDTFVNY